MLHKRSKLSDGYGDIKADAKTQLDNNKNITSWIKSRGVWYQLDYYKKLKRTAENHIEEICQKNRGVDGFSIYKDPDCVQLADFVKELQRCIDSITYQYSSYNIGQGGASGGGGKSVMMYR